MLPSVPLLELDTIWATLIGIENNWAIVSSVGSKLSFLENLIIACLNLGTCMRDLYLLLKRGLGSWVIWFWFKRSKLIATVYLICLKIARLGEVCWAYKNIWIKTVRISLEIDGKGQSRKSWLLLK